MPGATKQHQNIIRAVIEALWACRVVVASLAMALFLFSVPQARDVLLEVSPLGRHTLFWAIFWFAVAVVWLLPIYASSRYALHAMPAASGGHSPGRDSILTRVLPCMFTMIALAILLHGFVLARERMPLLPSAQDHRQFSLHLEAQIAIAFVSIVGLLVHLLMKSRAGGFQERKAREEVDPESHHDDPDLRMVRILSLVAAASIVVGPWVVSALLARAQMIPLLLGLWIAPLTLISVESARRRVPLIPAVIAVLLLIDLAFEGRYRVRTPLLSAPEKDTKCAKAERTFAAGAPDVPDTCKRPTFQEAFGRWRKANDCAILGNPGLCPKPIVVAADGGASRAAFFTGTVLGLLEDLSRGNPEKFRQFSRQTFAISAVSGSSLGAAHFVATRRLEDRRGPDLFKEAGKRGREPNWFGGGALPARASWKDTMQILASGDFLTPAVAHFLLRDVFSISTGTRADALEDAWSRHFQNVFDLQKDNIFSEPFTALGVGPDNRWLPILYLNGSSVETGHRIVVTPVDTSMPGIGKGKDKEESTWSVLLTDSFDFHDLINSKVPEKEKPKTADEVVKEARTIRRDVTLSTAVLSSARFPFISPHGTITNFDHVPIDRIVDGGYFETNGALTAIDIVDSLARVRLADFYDAVGHPKRPEAKNCVGVNLDSQEEKSCDQVKKNETELDNYFVVQISNDPEPGRCGAKVREYKSFNPSATLPMPKTKTRKFFSSFWSIIDGVASARTARGTHASEYLSFLATDDESEYYPWRSTSNPGFVHIRVCPPPGKVDDMDLSMSWWLSRPVQRYLNEQLCEESNVEGLAKTLLVLEKAFHTDGASERKALHNGMLEANREYVREHLRCPVK